MNAYANEKDGTINFTKKFSKDNRVEHTRSVTMTSILDVLRGRFLTSHWSMSIFKPLPVGFLLSSLTLAIALGAASSWLSPER